MPRGAGPALATAGAFGLVLLLVIPGSYAPTTSRFALAPGAAAPSPSSAHPSGGVSLASAPRPRAATPAASPSDPWSSITTTTAPTPRGAPACATDPSTNVTYCYGGAGVGSSVVDNDTWSYVNGTWTNLTSRLSPTPGPVAGGMMVYDPSQSAFFLFGGLNGYGGNPEANTWKFTGTKWTNLTSTAGTAPSARWGESFLYDPALGYSLLFGGWDNSGAWSDTWTFDAGKWSDVSPKVGTTPTARGWAASTYDPLRQSIVLTGGAGWGSYPFYDDTWELQAVAGQPSWSNVTTSVGTPPSARRMASMVFDPALGGDLFTGGDSQGGSGSWPNDQDVWALESAGWVNLTSSISSFPAGRFAASMFWDPSIGVATLFGGCTSLACASALNDTWEYSDGFVANLTAPSTVLVNSTVTLSGTAYGAPLGSRPTYSYNYSGLPPGCLSVNSSAVTCTPSATGQYHLRVNVTDLSAVNGSADLYAVSPVASLWVVQQVTGSFSLSRTALDVGQSFWINVSVSGGAGTLSYSYSGLPQGCASKNVSSLDCAPSAPGYVSITAIARDSLGHVVADQLNVTISPRLGVAGTESSGLLDVGFTVYLNATASGGSGGTTINWTLPGQNCPTSGGTLVCALNAPETLVPSVVARDSNGENATFRLGTIVVEPDPQVSYTAFPLAGASPLLVTFTTSTRGGVGPFLYEWEFGDGTSASFANGSHTFAVPGVYTGHLWLNDSLGRGAEVSVRVAVETAPTVTLGTLPGVAEVGFQAQLFANVTGGAEPFSFTWTALPTGCPYLDAPELNCTPTSPGTFQVGVQVRDADGVFASRSAFFTVVPTLAVNISLKQGTPSACPADEPVHFSAIVAGGAAPFSYVWTFGDGTESSQPDADHNYTGPGSYTVVLEVNDAAGIQRLANRTVLVVVPGSTCPTGSATGAGIAGLSWTQLGIGAVAGALVGAGVTAVLLRRREPPPDAGPEPAPEPTGPFWQDPDAPAEPEP